MDAREALQHFLETEENRVRNTRPSGDVVFSVIEVIRALDYQTSMLGNELHNEEIRQLYERYRFGWGPTFSMLYEDLIYDDKIPLFTFNKSEREWIDSIIQYLGKIQFCHQLLDFQKAGLLDMTFNNSDTFTFIHLTGKPGVEYYERISLSYYHSIVAEALKERIQRSNEQLPRIRKNLEAIVREEYPEFISYQCTDEADEFYSELGYLHMMTTQVIDEFDENDRFGSVTYRDCLDIAEYVFRSALMHKDCCMALSEKTNHRVFLKNILSHCFSRQKFISGLSTYLRWDAPKLADVVSCFTLHKDNYSHHLSYPGASGAPYIQLGDDTLLQTNFGSAKTPIFFLNRELKRKYPKDYFNAVNNRETRMRNQLYSLFSQDSIVKIHNNINLKKGKLITDIDAVLYDKESKALGLFQLKWQDVFSTSMRERYSRISNLFPKSNEWIDKISDWISEIGTETLLDTLQIDAFPREISDIYIFVIVRNHAHFTNQTLDERATWASWYQLVEAHSRIHSHSNSNPIAELAAKLKFFTPSNRENLDPLPAIQPLVISFPKYMVQVK